MYNKGNILVLTYWPWEDALIQTYTLPYVKQISQVLDENRKVFLLTQEKKEPKKVLLPVEGTKIIRNEILYTPFGVKAILRWIFLVFKLARFIRQNKIETIHAWCTPAGGIGYLLSLITGKKLVIDSFEPHAEAMVENGTWKRGSFAFRVMFFLERKQYQRANELICCVDGMKDYAKEKYGKTKARFFTKPACTDLNLFSPNEIIRNQYREKMNIQDKIVMVYAGKLGGIYFDKEVFEFAKACEDFWGDKFHFLLLTSESSKKILELMNQSNLKPHLVTQLFVPHKEVANYLQAGDFAITPVKNVPSKKYCTPIKDGEYWALGLPVIITKDISCDSYLIQKHNCGYVLDFKDRNEYQKSVTHIHELLNNNDQLESLRKRCRSIAEINRNFSISEEIYSTIYSNID